MEAALGRLRKLCIELGADDADVAASVHPSLRSYHSSMPGHYYSYSSYKSDAVDEEGEKRQVRGAAALGSTLADGDSKRVSGDFARSACSRPLK